MTHPPAPRNSSPGPDAGLGDGNWHRAHPLSIMVDGWIAIVGFIGIVLYQLPRSEDFDAFSLIGNYPYLAIGLAFLLISPIIRWAVTRFQIDDEYVRVSTGLLNKKHTQIRINRLQSVDMVRPFAARVMGQSGLIFDVADGGSEALHIRYVPVNQATQLRAEVLRRAGRTAEPGAEPTPSTPHSHESMPGPGREPAPSPELDAFARPGETELARLPRWLTFVLILAAPEALWLLVAALGSFGGVSIAILFTGQDLTALLAVVPLALAIGGVMLPRLNSYANFRLSHSSQGLRISSGFTSTTDQTLPAGRIQAVEVHQSWVHRALERYHVTVNVAGFVGGDQTKATENVQRHTVLPAGTWPEVERVMPLLIPDLPANQVLAWTYHLSQFSPKQPLRPEQAALEEQLFTAPAGARFFAPWSQPRLAAGVDGKLFVTRHGFISRSAQLVSLNRLQGVFLRQGPLQRLAGVISLRADVPAGGVHPLGRHLPVAAAEHLLAAMLAVASTARRFRDRTQWMGQAELREFNRRTKELVNE